MDSESLIRITLYTLKLLIMYARRLLFLTPLLALAACQSASFPDHSSPSIVRYKVSATAAMPRMGTTISFGEAALLALENNPGLKPFNPALRAADGNILQASLRPNPTIDGQVENIGGTGANRGFDAAESTLAVGQLIERKGKRQARRDVQLAEKALVFSDYEIARRDLFTEVGKAYAQALAAQEKVALYADFVTLNESFLPEIDKRIEAGKVTAVERVRARTAVTTARLAGQQAQREFRTASLRLAATWGSTVPGFTAVEGRLGGLPSLADQASLERRLINHPAYRKDSREISKSQAENRLAQIKGKPEVTVRGGVRHFWESNDVVFVKEEEGYKAVTVELGRSDGTNTEIIAGMKAGAIYAADNSFLLKAELGKSMAEEE